MASGCTRGGVDRMLGRISSHRGWPSTGTGCQGQCGSPHHWNYLRGVWMWQSGIWISNGTLQVKLMVGLDDLEGLFQPR